MPIRFITTGEPMIGSDEDDFILAHAGTTGAVDNTIDAGDGDDLVLGDPGAMRLLDQSASNGLIETAVDMDAIELWTLGENPMAPPALSIPAIQRPYATAICEATVGEAEVFSVTVGANRWLIVDIDFGVGSSIGAPEALIVEVLDGAGNVLASSSAAASRSWDEGSWPALPQGQQTTDPYLSFVAPTEGLYYVRVRPVDSATFTQNSTFVLHMVVQGHAVSANPPAGNDTIRGGAGNDTLYGQGGDDLIMGGAGDDNIHGGSGADTLQGGVGHDIIRADQSSGANLHGGAGDDLLDGGAVQQGGTGNDILRAGVGTQAFGGAGDDVLVSYGAYGSGLEVLNGGDGIDTLMLRRDEDATINLATGAAHYIYFPEFVTVDPYVQASGTVSGIENVITGAGADDIVGDAADNVISTGDGHDTVQGGAGADVMDGGLGHDTLNYRGSGAGVSVNLFSLTASGGDADGDVFSNFEHVAGSEHNDVLIGDDRDVAAEVGNVLSGFGGDDALSGRDGNDNLYGGSGDDVLSGGSGADQLQGGTQHDDLRGGDGDDRLYGQDGRDTLRGGNGADGLWGGAAADVLYGGAGADRLYGEAAADKLYGGDDNDILSGGTGNDILDGGAGQDTLDGGAGDDILISGSTMTGGKGRDLFVFLAGEASGTINDFSSLDTIRFDVADFADFDAVMAAATETANGVRIQLGASTDIVVLSGVQLSDLSADQFEFVGSGAGGAQGAGWLI